MIRWRRTDQANWSEGRRAKGMCVGIDIGFRDSKTGKISGLPAACSDVLKGIRVDDWVFGVSSVSADGYESPVASAVPGGAFKPYVAPVEKK